MVSTVIINLVLTLGLAVLFASYSKRLPTRSQFLLLLSTYLLWPAVLYSINLESGLSEHISTLLPVFCASLLVFVQVFRQFQTHVYPLKHQYKWSLIAVFVALLYLGVENIYLGWLDPPKQNLRTHGCLQKYKFKPPPKQLSNCPKRRSYGRYNCATCTLPLAGRRFQTRGKLWTAVGP